MAAEASAGPHLLPSPDPSLPCDELHRTMVAPAMESSLRRAVLEARRPVIPPDSTHAAVALVLYGDPQELLLIQRAEHPHDPWSGHMALPGGRQEPGDATLEATALRETREEVGLDLQEAELWGALAPVRARRPPGKSELWVTPYVYRIEGLRPVTQANEKEVAEIVWVPVSLLLRAETQTKRRVRHNGSTFILPAWQIGARMVWGLTHAIVSQLLSYTRPDHDVH